MNSPTVASTEEKTAPSLPDPLPIPQLLLRHLLPGAAVMLLYVPLGTWLVAHDLPAELGFVAAFMLAGVPLELGCLLLAGKKRHGRWTIEGAVYFREKLAARSWVLLGGLFSILMFVPLIALSPVSGAISDWMPAWAPAFLTAEYQWTEADSAQWLLVTTAIVSLILVGLVFPLIEELYFRGYLLSHAARHGWWAPTMCAALFTLQHYWQPHNWPLIFSLNLMLVHLVLAKRNLWIGYFLHAFGNTIGGLLTLFAVLG